MRFPRRLSCALGALALVLTACATAGAQTPAAPQGAVTPAPALVAAALAPSEDASRDPSEAPAGAYALDPRHTSVIWRIRHGGVGIYVGRFDTISGVLNFDPQAPENSTLAVEIDALSVSTGLLNGNGERTFDREIAQVLGAAENPKITFASTSVVRTGPDTGLVIGDMTMNGQTHPATFEVRFQGGRFMALTGKHDLAFSARTIIERSQWGVGNIIFNRFTGNQVEIVIETEFLKS